MEKSNKPIIIGIIGAVVALGVVIGVISVRSRKANDDTDNNTNTSQTSNEGKDEKTTASVTVDDLKNIDETITFGDYEAQKTLSKAIQNGEKTGKVVKIEGLVNHIGSSYSIVQQSEDGTEKIGTTFTIEDGTESDYPADEAHIVITGIVRADESGFVFTIKTLKSFVEVK